MSFLSFSMVGSVVVVSKTCWPCPGRASPLPREERAMTTYKPVKQDNLFRLFENDPNWGEAEGELKAACVEAAKRIAAIQDKYEDCGADDTDVREEITNFIYQLLLHNGWSSSSPEEVISSILDYRKRLAEVRRGL
jgi:hypothetical protein